MYDEDFERIKIVSTSSEIPIADFIEIFKYVENDSKKTLLDTFKEMTVSEKDCENLTGLSKNNFEDLVCRLQSINNSKNIRTSLLVFLCRLRTAMSYTLMATFFGFENGDKVRHQCDKIEKIFLSHIVPYFIGVNNLHRDSLLERGSLIAKELFSNSNLILICDGTYIYHEKSANNLYQRKSYSMHKHRHLCKPFTVCTTDGYIVDFFGPYNADCNDAKILRDIMEDETSIFANLLRENDVFVLDRGFRDVVEYLKSKKFVPLLPSFKPKNDKQLSCKEANFSRTVTKVRWVVEAVHGIIKKKWKYLSSIVGNKSLVKVRNYIKIAGALHNIYGKRLKSDLGKEEIMGLFL